MRKGKYIDYTVLLACLSKMPDRLNNNDESSVNNVINKIVSEDLQEDKAEMSLELEPA